MRPRTDFFVITQPLGTIDFDEEFGSSDGKYTLGEVFWTASNLFGSR